MLTFCCATCTIDTHKHNYVANFLLLVRNIVIVLARYNWKLQTCLLLLLYYQLSLNMILHWLPRDVLVINIYVHSY